MQRGPTDRHLPKSGAAVVRAGEGARRDGVGCGRQTCGIGRHIGDEAFEVGDTRLRETPLGEMGIGNVVPVRIPHREGGVRSGAGVDGASGAVTSNQCTGTSRSPLLDGMPP